eukprot:9400115-Ditylum_brightwellii.AAC.1
MLYADRRRKVLRTSQLAHPTLVFVITEDSKGEEKERYISEEKKSLWEYKRKESNDDKSIYPLSPISADKSMSTMRRSKCDGNDVARDRSDE